MTWQFAQAAGLLAKDEYPLRQTRVYPASPGASPNMTAARRPSAMERFTKVFRLKFRKGREYASALSGEKLAKEKSSRFFGKPG